MIVLSSLRIVFELEILKISVYMCYLIKVFSLEKYSSNFFSQKKGILILKKIEILMRTGRFTCSGSGYISYLRTILFGFDIFHCVYNFFM